MYDNDEFYRGKISILQGMVLVTCIREKENHVCTCKYLLVRSPLPSL